MLQNKYLLIQTMTRPINIKALRQLSANRKDEPATSKPGQIPLIKQVENFMSKDITFLGKSFSDKIKESFYLELGSLVEAGLDIRSSMELIRDEQDKKKPKAIQSEILNNVINGSSLSSAMKRNKNFTPYEYFTIEIGEETGKLVNVLKQLSEYYKTKIKQRRQIIGALTYPIIVLFVAFVSVSFMMNYVVPMFADVFKRFGGELPFLTRQVLSASQFVQASGGGFLLAATLIGVGLYANRKKHWYKYYRDYLLIKMPIVKNIASKIFLSRFSSTMQLLLSAKVPLVQALELSRQVMGFYPLEKALQQMEQDILLGIPLHQSMAGKTIFPSKMVALIKVGEEVNQLELFFKTLYERYSEELDYQTTQLSKFIEPLIIVILGLVVGVVLVAMYLPMFTMGSAME